MKRAVFFILGCVFLVVGVIGVVLPLLPGTINLILAAGFFAMDALPEEKARELQQVEVRIP